MSYLCSQPRGQPDLDDGVKVQTEKELIVPQTAVITMFFRVATPTTEAPTPEAGGRSTSSSSNLVHTSTHSEPDDIGWGDDDAGLTQVEQHPDVQPDSDDSDSINDLGLILRESLTISEVSRAIFRPYSRTKVHSANKPDRSFIFPKVHSNGCHRSFQQKWLDRLVYSKEVWMVISARYTCFNTVASNSIVLRK